MAYNGCILNQVSDFMIGSNCCKQCSDADLKRMLFFNDIETTLGYDIANDFLTIEEINTLLAFTGCLYLPASIISGTGSFAGGLVNNVCSTSNDDDDNESTSSFILSNYPIIGFTVSNNIYTCDIAGLFTYDGEFWLEVDNRWVFIGNATSQSNLLFLLNAKDLGNFTISLTILQAEGNHVYGRFKEAPIINSEVVVPVTGVVVDTGYAVALPCLLMSSAFDLSLKASIDGNTALYNNIGSVGWPALGFPEGAIVDYVHYPASPGQGYNIDTTESAALVGEANKCSIHGNTACIVYDRDFYEEYMDMCVAAGVTNIVVGISVISPLYSYVNALIVWASAPVYKVINDITNACNRATAKGLTITRWELGEELTNNNWAPLFSNPGGVEHGVAVLKKLLTHTNAGAPVSILQKLVNLTPSAARVVALTLWDAAALALYPTWNEQIMGISLVSGGIQYFQLYSQTVIDYLTARDRLAQIPDFFDYITGSDFHGKPVFVSQVEIKATSPIASRMAAGLILAELYIQFHLQNLSRGNVLLGVMDFGLNKQFDNFFNPRLRLYYLQMLGDLLQPGGELVEVTFQGEAEANLIRIGVKYGSVLKIGIINPTAVAYTQDAFSIDGVFFSGFTVVQRYAVGGDTMRTDDVAVTETGVFNMRPKCFAVLTNGSVVSTVDFSVAQSGLHIFFTNNDGGSAWLWDFGDGTTSTLQNPDHLYLTGGSYIVTLTIDGSDIGVENVFVIDGLQPLFGTAIFKMGDEVNNNTLNGVRATVAALMGHKYHALMGVGAENHWIRFVSATGYPTATPVSNVGFRANLDEIAHFAGSGSEPYSTQSDYNDTGIDFFTSEITYGKAHNQAFTLILNVAHGTLSEAQSFINYLIAQHVQFQIMYGNEQMSGATSIDPTRLGLSQTSDEYLAKVTVIDDWVTANHPTIRRIINVADHTTATWNNTDVYLFALSRGMQEFSQYGWVGDKAGSPNTETNIDLYYDKAIDVLRNSVVAGNSSLYGEILPRLTGYVSVFAGLKMYVGQYGVSIQRSGHVTGTMLNTLLLFNQILEFIKFNDTHNGFIREAMFLFENEGAVAKVDSGDTGWTIDPAFKVTVGLDTYALRASGLVYQMLRDLADYNGTVKFINLTFSFTAPIPNFGGIAVQMGTRVMLYLYNYGTLQHTITTTIADGATVSGNCSRRAIWSDKLYGSVGRSPSYTFFAGNGSNPTLTPVAIQLLDTSTVSVTNVIIKKISITRIELTSITDASNITLNIT